MIRVSWLKNNFIHRLSQRYTHHHLAKALFHALWFSIDALKKVALPNGRKADALPVCLIVGTAKSGKTALMQASQAEVVVDVPLNSTYQPMKAHSLPLFYVTYQAVFIEIPQYFLINESKKQIPYLEQLILCWRRAKLLERVDQVLFTISVDKLFQIEKNPQVAYDEFWHSLQVLFLNLPQSQINVICVLTELDRLPGFNEFFSDLSFEERQQYFGFAIHAKEHWLKSAQVQFVQLLKRLQRRMLWRCQSELILSRRLLIAEFPKQFEAVGKAFLKYMAPFYLLHQAIPSIRWQACFFSSALQRGETQDWLLLKKNNWFEVKRSSDSTALVSLKERPFFIRGIFQYLKSHQAPSGVKLFAKPSPSIKTPKSFKKILGLSALGFFWLIVFIYFVLWWHVASVLNGRPELAYHLLDSTYVEENKANFIDYEMAYLPKSLQTLFVKSDHLSELINHNAIRYVNKQWQATVVSFYQTNLAGRYPLNAFAKTDIRWNDFNMFYGANGIVANFSHKYLQASTIQNLLSNKSALQNTLNAAQLLSKELNSGSHFNMVWYPNQFGPTIKMIALELAGKKILLKPGILSADTFSWQATQPGFPASLVVTFTNGGVRSQFFTGDWAWLRLLQNFHYQRTQDPQTYILYNNLSPFSLQLNTDMPILDYFQALSNLTIPKTLSS